MAHAQPPWYQDAIIYEVHVRSFFDSDGDGIGDFQGLTQKLDYIQDLGVTALWLLPFFPSPLLDDGYDIADYTDVHPDYGTLADFQHFLDEAHRRGLKVIIELVLNHTSSAHPWFQRARLAAPGSPERDFYVWSETPERYTQARVIFADVKTSNWTWDPVARAYYWHRFFTHQPDLNFDNPEVRRAMFQAVDHWMGMGVDGMRLDAITYLFEREGTSCESLPETYDYLRELRAHIDQRYAGRMLLAEANQWPEDAANYFGKGDLCHMAFHFPLMPRLFMALLMEERFPIIDIVEQTPSIPPECQWATFLRNHDELTLEMVTDEERDFMYRVFAPEIRMRVNLGIRRRLAPLLQNDRRKLELLYALLFSLGGTPILYYGDEIGMGDNYHLGDRNGVRTPMQWSSERNAGFSKAPPQSLYLPVIVDPEYHYIAVNVENQEDNASSLLGWLKRLIALRRRLPALGRGEITFIHHANERVLSFVRTLDGEKVLVVANLCASAQHVIMEVPQFEGLWPVELWARSEFPCIAQGSMTLTMGPHAFFWFALSPTRPSHLAPASRPSATPVLEVREDWTTIFDARHRDQLSDALALYLPTQHWFEGLGRSVLRAEVVERTRMRWENEQAVVCMVEVRYVGGGTDIYVLPVAFGEGRLERELRQNHPELVIGPLCVESHNSTGVLYDAVASRGFCQSLLTTCSKGWSSAGLQGSWQGHWYTVQDSPALMEGPLAEPRLMPGGMAHTLVAFGQQYVLKLLRRLERGTSQDIEIGRYLFEQGFRDLAPLQGWLEYRRGRWEPVTVAVVTQFLPNQGSTLDVMGRCLRAFLAEAGARPETPPAFSMATGQLLHLARHGLGAEQAAYPMSTCLEQARQLGQLTARFHLCMSRASSHSAMAPEPILAGYERSRYQAMRNLAMRTLRLMRNRREQLPGHVHEALDGLLEQREAVLHRLRGLVAHSLDGLRIRLHGDYHLNEVIVCGERLVMVDFEGRPWLPIGERRIKRSGLADVASMLLSLLHVALTPAPEEAANGSGAEPWGSFEDPMLQRRCYWYTQTGAAFVAGYLSEGGAHRILPASAEAVDRLLDALLLERALESLERSLKQWPYTHAPLAMQSLMALLRAPLGSSSAGPSGEDSIPDG